MVTDVEIQGNWDPKNFKEQYGHYPASVNNCRTGGKLNMRVGEFMDTLGSENGRMTDCHTLKVILRYPILFDFLLNTPMT